MDEYISKHEAYKMLKDKQAAYMQVAVNEAFGTAARMIDQMKPADVQPVSRWISVKDRLPEEQQCILVHEKDYGVMLGDYQGIKYSQPVWIVRKQGLIMRTTEVTHWMELPNPPKGGDAK